MRQEATNQLIDLLIEKTENGSLAWREPVREIGFGDVTLRLEAESGSSSYSISKIFPGALICHSVSVLVADRWIVLDVDTEKKKRLWLLAWTQAQSRPGEERARRAREAQALQREVEDVVAIAKAAEEIRLL